MRRTPGGDVDLRRGSRARRSCAMADEQHACEEVGRACRRTPLVRYPGTELAPCATGGDDVPRTARHEASTLEIQLVPSTLVQDKQR